MVCLAAWLRLNVLVPRRRHLGATLVVCVMAIAGPASLRAQSATIGDLVAATESAAIKAGLDLSNPAKSKNEEASRTLSLALETLRRRACWMKRSARSWSATSRRTRWPGPAGASIGTHRDPRRDPHHQECRERRAARARRRRPGARRADHPDRQGAVVGGPHVGSGNTAAPRAQVRARLGQAQWRGGAARGSAATRARVRRRTGGHQKGRPGPLEAVAAYAPVYLTHSDNQWRMVGAFEGGLRWYLFGEKWGSGAGRLQFLRPAYSSFGLAVTSRDPMSRCARHGTGIRATASSSAGGRSRRHGCPARTSGSWSRSSSR